MDVVGRITQGLSTEDGSAEPPPALTISASALKAASAAHLAAADGRVLPTNTAFVGLFRAAGCRLWLGGEARAAIDSLDGAEAVGSRWNAALEGAVANAEVMLGRPGARPFPILLHRRGRADPHENAAAAPLHPRLHLPLPAALVSPAARIFAI